MLTFVLFIHFLRLLAPAAAIRHSIIHHLVLLRFDLALEYPRDFVTEWSDQNPLGQIGIISSQVRLRKCHLIGNTGSSLSSIYRMCKTWEVW